MSELLKNSNWQKPLVTLHLRGKGKFSKLIKSLSDINPRKSKSKRRAKNMPVFSISTSSLSSSPSSSSSSSCSSSYRRRLRQRWRDDCYLFCAFIYCVPYNCLKLFILLWLYQIIFSHPFAKNHVIKVRRIFLRSNNLFSMIIAVCFVTYFLINIF
jgi:hypothetical protein